MIIWLILPFIGRDKMKSESGTHEAIRKAICGYLDKNGLESMVSHVVEGVDVHFYHASDAHPKVHLADPDILVRDGDRFLAIEIEMSLAPKHLLGVATAVSQCNRFSFKGESMRVINNVSFLLVIEGEEKEKYGSHRPKQIRFIEDALQKMPQFKFAHLVGDHEAVEYIEKWRQLK